MWGRKEEVGEEEEEEGVSCGLMPPDNIIYRPIFQ